MSVTARVSAVLVWILADLEVMPIVGLRGSIKACATVTFTQLRIEPFCEMVEWVTCQLTRTDLRTPFNVHTRIPTVNRQFVLK